MYQNISFTTFLTLNARNEKPQRKPWQPFLQQKAVWFPQDGIFECQKDIQLSGKKKRKRKKDIQILQLFTRKAKVPFLKSWPHNFQLTKWVSTLQYRVFYIYLVSGQSFYCCATLLHRQVPQVWIEKCSGLLLIFLEIKILNMNELSKTQMLLENYIKGVEMQRQKTSKHGN